MLGQASQLRLQRPQVLLQLARGKKGGPAVPEPLAISLEADQGPLEGIGQVRTENSSCQADLIHNGASDAK